MTSTEQEGIYRVRSSTLLRGIHIDPTYTLDKALGIFFGKCPLWDLGTCLGSLSIFVKTCESDMRERKSDQV
jgi:hypothetical protein